MRHHQPSKTARRVALRRAAHQILDAPLILEDPFALRLLDPEDAAALQADPLQVERTPLDRILRAFLVARSRYAEDELALAVQRGIRQYVILGAGLDTFACRSPYPEGLLRVFEVDHPATQAWKRERLAEAGLTLSPDLVLAPMDFETQTLADGLRSAGWDNLRPTFFSWLGVTLYLTEDAVLRTLRFIASAPAGSEVVFDYGISPSLLNSKEHWVFESMSQRVAAAGEPWRAFFDPSLLAGTLRTMGFGHVKDLGAEEINARYFQNRTDGLQVGTLAHFMRARV
ncbi:MAG TPA: class I SAM-dependent methyltransferase [Thermoanaerobaculia bacterium]|nr:class I SAM-dependent methyltransferase [Thermoanaerobaculia bacterium]